jgi:hypothetical protein
MESNDALLNERQKTHGDFNEVARVSQSIRAIMKDTTNWESLNQNQREALEMICSKLGRILSGNHNFKDHWDDVAGYAKLGSLFSDDKKETFDYRRFSSKAYTLKATTVTGNTNA